MRGEIQFVDAAIGQMVDMLKTQGRLESTAIIITAKHGQLFFETQTRQDRRAFFSHRIKAVGIQAQGAEESSEQPRSSRRSS